MVHLIILAEYFAVASPLLLVVAGITSWISDYRFEKSLK